MLRKITIISLLLSYVLAKSEKYDESFQTFSAQDGIVEIEHVPYPQSKEFYKEIKSELDKAKKRSKRGVTIAYPANSAALLDFYLNLPSFPPGHVHAPITYQTRFVITLPNITIFGQARSMQERTGIFKSAETLLERFGLNGTICMLRAICERSEYDIVSDGLLGEIVTVLLSFATSMEDIGHRHYEEALVHGRRYGDCAEKYKDCPFSLFRWFEE